MLPTTPDQLRKSCQEALNPDSAHINILPRDQSCDARCALEYCRDSVLGRQVHTRTFASFGHDRGSQDHHDMLEVGLSELLLYIYQFESTSIPRDEKYTAVSP